jgi:hypothetical protein
MSRILLIFLLLVPATSRTQPEYAEYDKLLGRYVSAEGRVDYAGLTQDSARLRKTIAAMAATAPAPAWSRADQMACWINIYNAYTLQTVVEHYPVASIMDIDNGQTWEIARVVVGGRNYTLNEIEHEILRSTFRDPRIHFALNCAAVSCPPLMNKAYRGASLEATLEDRTRAFIRSSNNELTPFKARLSEIFKWYKSDFGDPLAFINRYLENKVLAAAAISYIPYDWSLND